MPNCPKCDLVCPEDAVKCGNCGEQIADAERTDRQRSDMTSKATAVEVLLKASRYWMMVLAAVLLVVTHLPAIRYWWNTWLLPNSYYSHGPLVPLIALFMVWSNRKRLAVVKISPTWWGLLLIVPAIPIFVFGRWTTSSALCSLSFFAFAIGAMLLFTGFRMTRLMLFPILYLGFMVPLPATILDEATLNIQLKSTTIAAAMLNASGYSVTQSGSQISGADLPEPLVVGAPCSGFRLLISLLAFTAFFVYMVNDARLKRLWEHPSRPAVRYVGAALGGAVGALYCAGVGHLLGGKLIVAAGALAGLLLVLLLPWKKWLLLFLSFPLTLFVNSLRITMIGYAGIWTGTADAMHKFHDWSGYIGLVVCFAVLFGIAKLIRADKFGISEPTPELVAASAESSSEPWRSVGRGWRGAFVVILFCLLLGSNALIRPVEAESKGHLDRDSIPRSFGTWMSEDITIAKNIVEMLRTADLLQRVYTDTATGRHIVVFVEAARDTTAFHDPHSCLPGSGSPITSDRIVKVKTGLAEPSTVEATMLRASGDMGDSLVIHWYMCGLQVYPSTPLVHKHVRAAQIGDLLDTVKHPQNRNEIRERIKRRQYYWYRFSTESWDEGSDEEALRQFIAGFITHMRGFGK